jgi:ketosteroid isomerase-like protein
MTGTELTAQERDALIEHWSTAAKLYMDGDLRSYADLLRHTEDYTLLPPYGGDVRRGFDDSPEAVERTARTFRGGDVVLRVIETYASGDLAALVAVERQHGTVADMPAQDWSLRLTPVFRREDGQW